METLSKLGVGPMSSQIIEAVFRFSQKNSEPLMLISTQNQIDWNGGYVNNWTTSQYMDYVKGLKEKYPQAKVYVCRDHCGPGFKNEDLESVYKTIESDIENGFDLVHIDFSKHKGAYDDILKESEKAIGFIKKKNSQVLIEIGTDENTGTFSEDVSRIEREMEFFTSIVPVQYFVCQTGSLIKETNQVGSFNSEFIKRVRMVADRYNLCLKEHNADYIDGKEIAKRRGLINAVNVAPQYGVLQTQLTLEKCSTYGIDSSGFLDEAYKSNRWKKWLYKHSSENKLLCSVTAGHYVFAGSAYRRIYEQISKYEDFKEAIINEMVKNFGMYTENL